MPMHSYAESSSGKHVGIWIRVSTEDQAKGESPAHHEKRARYYAEAKGWQITEVYNLSGVSGKSVLGHPEARRMLKDVKGGRISGLIFSKIARLARNTKELLELSDIFREYQADLISLNEAIDTTSPAGRLFYTMIAALAQWEREEIAERVAASIPIRAKLGKRLGGAASLGYEWKDKKLVPNPAEVAVRRLIYQLFLRYKRKKTVARVLNERGFRTRNGSKFTTPTVHRLLKDSTAVGVHRSNYTTKSKDGHTCMEKPQSEWVFNQVEPIISEDVWQQCNTILDQISQNRKPRGRLSKHLFAGVTVCSCGKRMYVPTNMPKYYCQSCCNKIPSLALEMIFQEQLKSFYFSDAEINKYLNRAETEILQLGAQAEILDAEQQQNGREMDRLYRLYMAEGMSIEEFKRRYRTLEERQKQISAELPSLRVRMESSEQQIRKSGEIISEARDLYSRWASLSHDEKRQIIEAITETIKVGRDEIDITLNSLDRGEADPNKGTELSTPVIEKTRCNGIRFPECGFKYSASEGGRNRFCAKLTSFRPRRCNSATEPRVWRYVLTTYNTARIFPYQVESKPLSAGSNATVSTNSISTDFGHAGKPS